MTDTVKAWQCIGCGRIEAPQPCIGVCQDRRVEFVYAGDFEEASQRARSIEHKAELLAALARQLALTNPRDGEWERCYRALQARARGVLAQLDADDGAPVDSNVQRTPARA